MYPAFALSDFTDPKIVLVLEKCCQEPCIINSNKTSLQYSSLKRPYPSHCSKTRGPRTTTEWLQPSSRDDYSFENSASDVRKWRTAIGTLAANPKVITECSVVKGTASERPDSEKTPGKRRNLVWKGCHGRSQSVWAVTKTRWAFQPLPTTELASQRRGGVTKRYCIN